MQHPDMNESWVGGHPDEGLLHEWLDEQLPATDAAAIQVHVDACPVCQARVAEARGLMAAAHRILSALDEVPANVIPANIATGAVVAENTLNGNVLNEDANAITSMDAARKSSRGQTTRVFPWQTVGKIAAVLLFAVALGKSGLFRSDDVIVPVQPAVGRQAAESVASTSSAPMAVVAARNENERVANATPAAGKKSAPSQTAASSKLAFRKQPAQAEPAATVAESPPAPASASVPVPAAKSRALAVQTSPQEQAQGTGNATRAKSVAGFGSRTDTSVLSPMTVTVAAADRAVARQTIGTSIAQVPDSSLGNARRPIPELSGKVAGAQVVAAPAAPMPLPPAAVADRIAPRDTSTQAGAAAGRGAPRSLEEMGRTSRMQLNEMVVTSVNPAAKSSRLIAAVSRAPFDSLTLNRTVCTPTCEATILHINALGDVRLAAGEGNTQRVVMATLPAGMRDSISALVIRTFPDSAQRFGRTTCEVRDKESLRLTIDYAVKLPARADNRCGKSNDALRKLGASIDSIAGFDALKLRLPRKE